MGRTNVVYTGVAIKYGDKIHKFSETTDVTFGHFDDTHIQAYVDTGEPMWVHAIQFHVLVNDNILTLLSYRDKAGGYGIQHIGSTLIERINGDYYSVMGLPLYRLARELRKLYEENNNWERRTKNKQNWIINNINVSEEPKKYLVRRNSSSCAISWTKIMWKC